MTQLLLTDATNEKECAATLDSREWAKREESHGAYPLRRASGGTECAAEFIRSPEFHDEVANDKEDETNRAKAHQQRANHQGVDYLRFSVKVRIQSQPQIADLVRKENTAMAEPMVESKRAITETLASSFASRFSLPAMS